MPWHLLRQLGRPVVVVAPRWETQVDVNSRPRARSRVAAGRLGASGGWRHAACFALEWLRVGCFAYCRVELRPAVSRGIRTTLRGRRVRNTSRSSGTSGRMSAIKFDFAFKITTEQGRCVAFCSYSIPLSLVTTASNPLAAASASRRPFSIPFQFMNATVNTS